MLRLAFRNLFRHRGRTALTLAAIVLGVAGLILTGGFVQDVFARLREATIHSHLGHLQIYRQGYYAHGRRNPYAYLIEKPDPLAARVQKLPQVTLVTERLNFSGLLSNGHADLPIVGEGVEPAKEARLGSFITITAGHQLKATDKYGILLGQGVSDALHLHPGDYATLLLNTPAGALNSLDFKVIGVFRSISKDFDNHAVRIPLGAAQEVLNTRGVHSLVVLLSATRYTDSMAARLRHLLPAADYEVKTWKQLAGFYEKTVNLYRRQFLVLQLIILVLVLLGVANSVTITVYDRVGEFGTLMALGDRGAAVFRLLMSEFVLLGLLGSALGVAAGAGLAVLISAIGIPMPPPPNMNVGYVAQIRIVPQVLGLAFAVGAVATILAAVLPARRVARMPVVEALRQN
ncbi:MAG: ABC transporter permease [Gammaproteobacteria bacterium]